MQHSPAGPILATGGGNTLYDFAPDTPTHSACLDDGCVFQWPPLLQSGPVRVGPGVDPALGRHAAAPRRVDPALLRRPPALHLRPRRHARHGHRQGIDQNGGLWYVLSGRGKQVTTAFSVVAPNVDPNG